MPRIESINSGENPLAPKTPNETRLSSATDERNILAGIERRGARPTPSDEAPTRRERLKRFLDAYWLRPENAFWMALRSETLASCVFDSPSADFCCGDGIFSFLHHGGVFDPGFDVFGEVRAVEPGALGGVDMFDHVTDDYRPPVWTQPDRRIDVGTDLKQSLLAKAARLHMYRRLVEHDNNRPLPFATGCFRTLYCNAAYWVTNIDSFIAELRRICKAEGRLILHVKLDSFHRHTLAAHRRVLGDRFLEKIIGSRLESWPTLASRTDWESRFTRAGFSIEAAVPFVTASHARIWEVGLRPIAPLLVRMANQLTSPSRASIKRDWVALMLDLTEPLCDPGLVLAANGGEPVEIQYVLASESGSGC